jgi:hypothetical protein
MQRCSSLWNRSGEHATGAEAAGQGGQTSSLNQEAQTRARVFSAFRRPVNQRGAGRFRLRLQTNLQTCPSTPGLLRRARFGERKRPRTSPLLESQPIHPFPRHSELACFLYQSERLPSRFNGHHACSPTLILVLVNLALPPTGPATTTPGP